MEGYLQNGEKREKEMIAYIILACIGYQISAPAWYYALIVVGAVLGIVERILKSITE